MEPRNSSTAEALAVGSAGAASTRPSKRRGIVGSAGVAERGKGTGWIVWEPGGQTYPTGPITLVVPYPAAGLFDAVARVLAEPMRKVLGEHSLKGFEEKWRLYKVREAI